MDNGQAAPTPVEFESGAKTSVVPAAEPTAEELAEIERALAADSATSDGESVHSAESSARISR